MNLERYKEELDGPLRIATLCFLIKDQQVLLAMKKRGFGEGRWNGVGGSLEDGESVEEAAVRETKEEICVLPLGLMLAAELDFYFPHEPDSSQQVHVYLAENWEGEPQETEEMWPQWYLQEELPLDEMWPDDKHWLPLVLGGKRVRAEFLFDDQDNILEMNLEETDEI